MRKLVLALLTVLFCLSLLCACSPKNGEEQTAGTQTTAESSQTTPAEQTQTTQEVLPSETTNPPETSGGQSNETGIPSTKAEIISLFNEAVNKVKQTKPGYTFSSKAGADKKNITVSDNVPFHSFIASFAASAVNSAKKEPVTVAKSANHDDFPVKGQPWASRLDASALLSASLKENGNYYEIELKFKDEKLASLPEKNNQTAHGKVFSLLLAEDFRNEFGGFNTKFMGINIRVDNQKFEPAYKGSTIKCKIDKAGKLLSAVYYLNTISDVDMMVEVNSKDYLIGIKLEYSMTETYTIG